jgi:hypothetical protein
MMMFSAPAPIRGLRRCREDEYDDTVQSIYQSYPSNKRFKPTLADRMRFMHLRQELTTPASCPHVWYDVDQESSPGSETELESESLYKSPDIDCDNDDVDMLGSNETDADGVERQIVEYKRNPFEQKLRTLRDANILKSSYLPTQNPRLIPEVADSTSTAIVVYNPPPQSLSPNWKSLPESDSDEDLPYLPESDEYAMDIDDL